MNKRETKTKKLTVIHIFKGVKIYFENLKIYKGCNILTAARNSNWQEIKYFKNCSFWIVW